MRDFVSPRTDGTPKRY